MKKQHQFLKAWCAAFVLSATVVGVSSHANAQNRPGTEVTTDVPRTISYQGLIANGDKPIADGKHSFTFTLYADEQRQTPIWSGSYSLDTKAGLVNAMLGSGAAPLPTSAEMNKPLWLGIRVDGDINESSLTQLSAAAYALNVGDKAITSAKLADQSVTADKMGTDYVASVSVNGQAIKGKGTELKIEGGPGLEVKYNRSTSTIQLKNTNIDPKGPKVQWTGYNPGTNDDGSAGYAPNNDLTNTIGGGDHNQAFDPAHTSTSWHAAVLGGEYNYAHGSHSAIPGGQQLKIGSNSFGFNNKSSTTAGQTDVSASSDLAYFGNVDMWVGNSDGSRRSLRFLEDHAGLTPLTGKYIGLRAPASITGVSTTFTLPEHTASTGQFLTVNPANDQLSWSAPSVTSVNWGSVLTGVNTNQDLQVTGAAGHLYPAALGTVTANDFATTSGALTAGSVPFGSYSTSGAMDEDNANLYYTGASGTPASQLQLGGSGTIANPVLDVKNGNQIKLSNGTGYSTFAEPAGAAAKNYTLPPAYPVGTNYVLASTTTGGLSWQNVAALGGAWTTAGNSLAGGEWLGTQSKDDLVIKTWNTEWMRIKISGKVGIGTSTPTLPLEVNGAMRSSNSLGNGATISQKGEIHSDNIDLAWGVIPPVVLAGAPISVSMTSAAGTVDAYNVTAIDWYPPNICVITLNVPSGFAASSGGPWSWAGFGGPGAAYGQASVTANVIEDYNFQGSAGDGSAVPTTPPSPWAVVGNVPGFCTVMLGGQAGLPGWPGGAVCGFPSPTSALAANQVCIRTYQMGPGCGSGPATITATPLPFSFRVVGR